MNCSSKEPLKITQGEDRVLFCKIRNQNGDPYDLTGGVVVAKFKKTDGTLLSLSSTVPAEIVIESAILGIINIFLTDAQTALLRVGEAVDFEVQVTISDVTKIVLFSKAITVKKALS